MKKNSHLPSYKTPPVVEVVAGIQFSSLTNLQSVHLGTLWDIFGRENFRYEETQPLQKIGTPFTPLIQVAEKPRIPRAWFISQDENTLIQFQDDRFLYNWRKKDDKSSYPRYENVIKSFFQNYTKLKKFLNTFDIKALKVEAIELTYVNIIPLNEKKTLSENIKGMFTDIEWNPKHRFLPSPKEVNLSWIFDVQDIAARMQVNLASAQRIQDGASVLKMETVVQGQFSDDNAESMKIWYDKGREWIVKTFDELTTPTMHEYWGKIA